MLIRWTRCCSLIHILHILFIFVAQWQETEMMRGHHDPGFLCFFWAYIHHLHHNSSFCIHSCLSMCGLPDQRPNNANSRFWPPNNQENYIRNLEESNRNSKTIPKIWVCVVWDSSTVIVDDSDDFSLRLLFQEHALISARNFWALAKSSWASR